MSISVLLVDDDEDDRAFFEEAIQTVDSNVQFESLSSGVKGCEYIENCSSPPNAIFLDINMPNMDGYECLERLRSKSNYDNIVVIIYSTSYNYETAVKFQDAGANYFLQKPTSFTALKQLIERALNLITNDIALNRHNVSNFLIANEKQT